MSTNRDLVKALRMLMSELEYELDDSHLQTLNDAINFIESLDRHEQIVRTNAQVTLVED